MLKIIEQVKERQVSSGEGVITLHDQKGFEGMRVAGALAKKVLNDIQAYVKPGVTTNVLNALCHEWIIENDAIPAPLNYKGFPKSICTSVNHVVCHGIPGEKALRSGDILNIDVTVIKNGWHGDSSRMFLVGAVSKEARQLTQVTYDALMGAIDLVKPGAFLGDIGAFIESLAHRYRFSVVQEYCGHGIGRVFHTAPSVLHFGQKGTGLRLEPGMFFTIEPMLNSGRYETRLLSDGWTVVTKDKSLSAQWEHTIGVTENGYEVFTG